MTASRESGYARLWRALPRELGFTLASLPIVITSCVVLWTGLSLGVGLAIVWVGLPLLAVSLIIGRWFGSLEMTRLEAAGRPAIPRPDWNARATRPGLFGRFLHVAADGRYWLQALHGAVVNLVVGTVTWSIAITWISLVFGGLTYWFWGSFASTDLDPLKVGSTTVPWWSLYAAVGLIALLTLPIVLHALVLLHDVIARAMLGEWRVTALRRAAAAAEASRESAVLAEDRSLRRLERDIHDGPQQGLLRIQFDLASASRAMKPGDPAAALVEGALALTKETLHELRELSRGLAPPLLQDRGLVSAVTALAARSEVPVTATIELAGREASLVDVERSIYFVVAELLSNTAKHARASAVTLRLAVADQAPDAELKGPVLPGTVLPGTVLRVEIGDDGVGGASEIAGHGLDGIRQRIAGLRGEFRIDSPAGGPSRFVVVIPLR
ncbi:hypothetical protein AX769_09470 [Frondihabitans sp. PAMC 28766]|uniref:sensor histidine kinase n=1 Tax=Frondihabitans sp. PAMC 28766 TaxID=1795630 RepID=UPI00078D8D90|nr:sensor histidine kinase [Frondihabitans sp. PAMC 28766]AMM20340.1 hypothetical protein AX769_09470 [Frondihabitans sp. PAMC 28766]